MRPLPCNSIPVALEDGLRVADGRRDRKGSTMDDYEPEPARCWVCDAMLEPSGRCRACEYVENAGERLDPAGYARDAEAEEHDPFLQWLRESRAAR